MSARIMAVADVYDALTCRRVYKDAWSHEKSVDTIVSGRGRHFDPDIVDSFVAIKDSFNKIAIELSDNDMEMNKLKKKIEIAIHG